MCFSVSSSMSRTTSAHSVVSLTSRSSFEHAAKLLRVVSLYAEEALRRLEQFLLDRSGAQSTGSPAPVPVR